MSHTQSHTEKSSALCSLAAEVQMVYLYASLTQCRSFTSALLCLLLLDSVHHSSTPDTLLGFALSSSLCHTLQLSHSLFLSLCSLKNTQWFSLNVKKNNGQQFLTSIYLKCIQCLSNLYFIMTIPI